MGLDSQYEEGEEEQEQRRGLTIAELVSELLYAGKSLAEVAGYDTIQMVWVVCRKRDKWGRLVRNVDSLPPWVAVGEDGMRIVTSPMPFQSLYYRSKIYQGADPVEAHKSWQEYQLDNPKLGRGGEPEYPYTPVSVNTEY